MKDKFSFSNMLNNDKLMIICSIILGIIIWYSVVYGPSVTEEKSITVPISVQLNTSASEGDNLPNQYFQVLSKSEDSVEVVVSGNRSVLSKLKAEDIVVSADMTDVLQAVDDYTVELKASKNRSSTITDYTIERIKTRQVRVTCDYVGQTKYRVEKDISTVKVADDTKYQLGTPSLDSQLFPQESVTVSGPKRVRDQITRVVAKVNQNKELKESTVLEAKLMAYDKNNKQVDLSGCTFPDLSEQEDPTIAQLTVPVNYFCRAELGIKATNLPEAYQDQEGFLTITPSSLELLGQESEVLKALDDLKKIPLDFDNVSLNNKTVTIALNIPSHVTVADNVTSVKVAIDMSGFTSRTISVPLFRSDGTTLASNVTLKNRPSGNLTLTTKTLSVTVVGKESDVKALKASDLQVAIDMKTATETGALNAYPTRVTLPDKKTIWVYYGKGTQDSLSVYVNTKS